MHRQKRLNSLLVEVISETIRKDVKHPDIHEFITITRVDITKDLHFAKVYFSVIGEPAEKEKTLTALSEAAGFIALKTSKKVTMRYFPELSFYLDSSLEKQLRLHDLFTQVEEEKKARDGQV